MFVLKARGMPFYDMYVSVYFSSWYLSGLGNVRVTFEPNTAKGPVLVFTKLISIVYHCLGEENETDFVELLFVVLAAALLSHSDSLEGDKPEISCIEFSGKL
jgi:hypothetical protein